MKKVIRLTESDLHKIVKESVQKILNETSLGKLRAARDKASTDIKGYNVLKTFPSAASDKASDSVKGMLPDGWKPPHSGFDKAIGDSSKSTFAGRMADRRREQMDNISSTINNRQDALKALPYKYQADFENAIDCLYYGEGKANWFNSAKERMSDEDANNLWKIAVQFMSQDEENDWKRWLRRDWIRGDVFKNKNNGIDFDEF